MPKKESQGSLKYIEPFEKAREKNAAQGSLEYIILIGGVIILSAASYFMLKGFSSTTSQGSSEAIGIAGDKFRLELDNLGRSETRFLSKSWFDPNYGKKSTLIFSDCADSMTFNLTNLSLYGVDTADVVFTCGNGTFNVLKSNSSLDLITVNLTSSCCVDGNSTLFLFYNNSSSLNPLCGVEIEGTTVTETGCFDPESIADRIPPHIIIPSSVGGWIGSANANIYIDIDGTGSRVAELYYSIDNSDYFKVDNLYYAKSGDKFLGTLDGSYGSEYETLRVKVKLPDFGNYVLTIKAIDEYANQNTSSQIINLHQGTSEYLGGCEKAAVNIDNTTVFEVSHDFVCGCDGNGGYNLVTNWNFSDGVTDWLNDSSVSINDTEASVGLNSAHIVGDSPTPSFKLQQILDSVPNNIEMDAYLPPIDDGLEGGAMFALVIKSGGDDYMFFYSLNQTPAVEAAYCGQDPNAIDTGVYIVCNEEMGTGSWTHVNVSPIDHIVSSGFMTQEQIDSASTFAIIVIVIGFNGDTYELLIDNVSATSTETLACDSGNDNGIADGFCHNGECVPMKIVDYTTFMNPSFNYLNTNFSINFSSVIPVDSCSLNVGSNSYPMVLNTNNATYSGIISSGTYSTSVSCSLGGKTVTSESNDLWVTKWNEATLIANDGNQHTGRRIAGSGSNLHAVIQVTNNFHYINSSDNGQTWSGLFTPTFTSMTTNTQWLPAIAVNNSDVYLTFRGRNSSAGGGYRMYYMNSSDSGRTWSENNIISYVNWTVAIIPETDIGIAGSDMHVVYYNDNGTNQTINYVNSSNLGASWSQPIALAVNSSNKLDNPGIAVDGSNLHVIWISNDSGTMELMYTNSSDEGLSWSNPVNLSNLTGAHPDTTVMHPRIAVDVSDVYVFWTWDYNYAVLSYSGDSGSSWSESTRFGSFRTSDIYVSGGRTDLTYSMWPDWPDVTYGNVFHRYSLDKGASWTEPVLISVHDGVYNDFQSAVTRLNGRTHVIFSDSPTEDILHTYADD